jgi:3-oxoadipate enol-lactonase
MRIMPYVDLPAGKFFYRYDGSPDAPVLILSNSLGTDCSVWSQQVSVFAHHFRVLRYDGRGHGISAVLPGPYTIADLGWDVVHLCDALGIKQAHYCGLSLGGMVGMWLAANVPEHIDKLVLCNTAARLGPPQLWDARIESVRTGGMASIVSSVLVRWFTESFITRSPDTIAQMRQTLAHTPEEGYIACCEAIRDMDQRSILYKIRSPTLVVAGSLDAASPPTDGRFLASSIAGARYVELDGAHMTNIEAVQPFNDAVLDFLLDKDRM